MKTLLKTLAWGVLLLLGACATGPRPGEAPTINPQAKVLIMSGYSEEGGVEALIRHGAMGFLAKPFRPDAVGRQVEEILRAKPTP